MRRRRKTALQIFSMSALDLFASALGAFMLIAIILFPYFTNTSEEDMLAELEALAFRLEQCQRETAPLVKLLETRERENNRIKSEILNCENQDRGTYLAVVINWPTKNHDVDLHVTDLQGREFYYKERRFPGSDAELSADTVKGPGIEIWEIPVASPGTYKVEYKFYDPHGNPQAAPVEGRVYYRNGQKAFPDKVLTYKGEKILVTHLEVTPQGEIRVN